EVKRMRSPFSPESRSRSLTRRTSTGPIPVWITRSGPWPCRTMRSRPSARRASCIEVRKASASASTACANSRRAPSRRTAVKGSLTASGWRRGCWVRRPCLVSCVPPCGSCRSGGRSRETRDPSTLAGAAPAEFDDLPDQQDGNAEREIPGSPQQRNRKRKLRRLVEQRADPRIGRFLHPGMAGHDDGDRQYRVQQGLDRQRPDEVDVGAEQPEGDPAGKPCSKPGEQVKHDAERDPPRGAVNRG